ncbi:hypothetical protein LCL95_11055 [Bacillus timonensis]|nr:hypothetical protein [Bacillus timonensis]
MKKWAITAVVYLLAVIGGYFVYSVFMNDTTTTEHVKHETDADANKGHGEHGEEKDTEGHGEHGGHESAAPEKSEVVTKLNVVGNKLTINITDLKENPVEELEVNHEKLLHLIIVDEHLDQYYHLHPEQIDVGVFQTDIQLKDGTYKAFIDIKPKKLSYKVLPVEFKIGDTDEHGHGELKEDVSLTKTIDGQEASLHVSSYKIGEPIILDFTLPNAELQPYLGAMGHVVILDEHAENYIHVHPLNDTEPKFETKFETPGLYKLWGEFQIDGKIYYFPYVIKVQ